MQNAKEHNQFKNQRSFLQPFAVEVHREQHCPKVLLMAKLERTYILPLQIPATMTAAEMTFEILDRRKINVKEKDYWCCFEVNEKDETGWGAQFGIK